MQNLIISISGCQVTAEEMRAIERLEEIAIPLGLNRQARYTRDQTLNPRSQTLNRQIGHDNRRQLRVDAKVITKVL
jgi:hypothetical protein